MLLRLGILGLLPLIVLAITPATAHAQKPRADVLYPVTAEFRCPLGLDCYAPDRTDRIAGDSLGPLTGTTPSGSSSTSTGLASNHGAYFNVGYVLELVLKQGYGRYMTLDFTEGTGSVPCEVKANCRRDFDTIYTDHSLPPGQVVPVDAAGRDLTNGFYGIAVGQTVAARYKINFQDPSGADLLWTVRFSPSNYPGSSWVRVTRTGTNAWVVEATSADTAMLESATMSGKSVKTHEGFYRMPFRITVTR